MPTFVTDLIKGVFEAIVDVSIRQMEAYAELLRNIAKPVDEFMRDNEVSGDGSQQQLATMVLMGINRLVVTKGTITASVAVDLARGRCPRP